MINLYNDDCLSVMKKHVKDNSIDLILCDLPYGTTKCKWDTIIPFKDLWEQYERVIKDNGAIILFSKQPFTTKLINSNIDLFKYTLVWKKDNHDNPFNAKIRILNITEDICIFYKQQPTYNPQGIISYNKRVKQGTEPSLSSSSSRADEYIQEYTNYPTNVLEFGRDLPNIHPTQKPVALLKYLIKTFSNEGDLVLDNCMGSGSTGVASKMLDRSFIGIELNKEYYSIAEERIKNTQVIHKLF